MIQIGNKIRRIRELKNITPKDMADRLNLTPSGYNKIERDESSINLERLQEIADIFEMKPEDVMTFDEKYVFQNYGEIKGVGQNIGPNHYYNFPEEMKKLYEDNIRLQAEQIKMQQKIIEMLEERLKGFVEKK